MPANAKAGNAKVIVGMTMLTAVVHAPDGVGFVATAECSSQLSAQLAEYVRARCDAVLWPQSAAEVRALIENGMPHAAIALYFANVGDRWDEERLDLGGLPFG